MKSKTQFWLFSFLIFITLRYISNFFIEKLISINYTNPFVERFPNIFSKLLIVVIIIPIIETFFYFYLIYIILKYFLKERDKIVNILFISTSTCLFSLDHRYHISYLINAVIAGLLYSSFFIIYSKKNMNPFWCVALLHLFYNSFVLMNEYLY